MIEEGNGEMKKILIHLSFSCFFVLPSRVASAEF